MEYQMQDQKQLNFVFCLIVFSLLSACQSVKAQKNPDVLWYFVNQKCVPNFKVNNNSAPCDKVELKNDGVSGHVVFKDKNGPLQYLLMPTEKITGIEDPKILDQNTLNYFAIAWKERDFMAKKYNAPIDDSIISLTINSSLGRSQNQLHVHISCIRPDIAQTLSNHLDSLTENWSLIPGGLMGHHYFFKSLELRDLMSENSFLILQEIPEAKNNIGEFGMGLVVIKDLNGAIKYILLADQALPAEGDYGSVEEIQDHTCPQLFTK
jgi:CDP-diacylglycerol pyrophosphatase